MTGSSLRVSRRLPLPGLSWFKVAGPPYGHLGSDEVNNAVYYNGNTYLGVVDGDGNARVLAYNHTTRAVTVSPAVVAGLGADIHCTPSVLVRSSDHKLVVAAAPHGAAHMYVAISTNAEDVSAWGAATDINATIGGTSVTYAHLVQLSGESAKIYLFYRDQVTETSVTNRLCFSTSTDGGATWSAHTELYENANKQSYWVIGTDNASRIDFAVSDGNASSGDTASLYHFYYTGGGYHKSDGTVISTTLPLSPTDPTKISDGATNGSVRIPYSIIPGTNPVVAWAAYNTAGSGQPENYWYSAYSSGWTPHQIDTSGATPFAGFTDGGVAIDRIDTTRVYVSRQSSGYWQVFLYQTANSGSTWTNTQLTSDSGTEGDVLNLRPVTPLNAASGLRAVWCFGPHYSIATGNGSEPPATQLRGYPATIL